MRRKVIFLDIDGVLNHINWFDHKLFNLIDFLKLKKWFLKHYDVFGVRTYRVFLLWILVCCTGAELVLSSSWRHLYMNKIPRDGRCLELETKLRWFGLEIVDSTGTVSTEGRHSDRGMEIKHYLDTHDGIVNFVILDDESFDIVDTLGYDNFVKTSSANMITGSPKDNSGLKIKDVIKAIKILNRKECVRYGH